MTTSVAPKINSKLVEPARLQLLGLLSTSEWCWLGFLKQTTGLTKGPMDRHLGELSALGYIVTTRGVNGRTWIRLTSLGAKQLSAHLAALASVVPAAREQAAATREAQPDWFEVMAR